MSLSNLQREWVIFHLSPSCRGCAIGIPHCRAETVLPLMGAYMLLLLLASRWCIHSQPTSTTDSRSAILWPPAPTFSRCMDVALWVVLTEPRQPDLLQVAQRLQRDATMTLIVMQALGLMVAAHPVVPLGPLHMPRLQRWFASLCLDARRHKQHLVSLLPSVQDRGWGGTCLRRVVGGALGVTSHKPLHAPNSVPGSPILCPPYTGQTLVRTENCTEFTSWV